MRGRRWVGLAALLAVLFAPLGAAAQDEAPIPQPRPKHLGGPTPEVDGPVRDEIVPGELDVAPDGQTANDAAAALALPPQPVTLSARIVEDGDAIPDGLVWRVFDTRTDTSGELALVYKSEDARASFALSPGEYVVHVAYGRAQTSDTIQVAAGENAKSIVLDAGALRLNAAVAGDVAIPTSLVRFDVFTSGGNEADRTLVAQGITPSDLVTLNSGVYHIVSHFGTVNAVVRADLRVEPGQLTDATLYHHAAQVSFKLVTEPGGEAIADIDWTVKSADGATLFTDLGAFPSTVLAEGDYLVLAKRGESVFNRSFQVKAGLPQDIEVLTTVY